MRTAGVDRAIGHVGTGGLVEDVDVEGALTRAEIRLEPSCSLEGSVIDDQHDPIADAGVELLSLIDDATLFSTRYQPRSSWNLMPA